VLFHAGGLAGGRVGNSRLKVAFLDAAKRLKILTLYRFTVSENSITDRK